MLEHLIATRRFFLVDDGDLVELVTFDKQKQVKVAYTTTLDDQLGLLSKAEQQTTAISGSYTCFNKLHPAISARIGLNNWVFRAPRAKDSDITQLVAVYLDFDAKRPTDISSTDAEKQAAYDASEACRQLLSQELGTNDSIARGDSGNGYSIFIAIEPLPPTKETALAIKRFLQAMNKSFSSDMVEVDQKVYNPARLCPAFGTSKRKGVNTQDRPHRKTSFSCSLQVQRVPLDALVAIANKILGAEKAAAPKPRTPARSGHDPFRALNEIAPEMVVDALGIEHRGKRIMSCPGCGADKGCDILDHCVKCQHNSCADKGRNGAYSNVDLIMQTLDCQLEEAIQFGNTHFGTGLIEHKKKKNGKHYPTPVSNVVEIPHEVYETIAAQHAEPEAEETQAVAKDEQVAEPEVEPEAPEEEPKGRWCAPLPKKMRLPNKYTIEDDGHMFRNDPILGKDGEQEGTKPVFVSFYPVWVAAELERDGDNVLRLDAIVNKKVVIRYVRRGLLPEPRKLAAHLEGTGFSVPVLSQIAFSKYLQEFQLENAMSIPLKEGASQTGWDAKFKSFLLGKECCGRSNRVFYTEQSDAKVHAVKRCGNTGQWVQAATDLIKECPAAALVLAASVSAPMIRLLRLPLPSLMLAGMGGTGKSSLLALAASVWGGVGDSRHIGGIVGSGLATVNAFSGQFMTLNDMPHLMDEMKVSTGDPRQREEVSRVLHQLIDGVEKSRLSREGLARISRKVIGPAVIASETDPEDFMRLGGVIRRILPLRPPFSTGEPLGRHLPKLRDHHGHAGRALVAALVDTSLEEREAYHSLYREHEAKLLAADVGEPMRSWGSQIATMLTAIEVATQLCPQHLPQKELWIAQTLKAWANIQTLAPKDSDPAMRCYDRIVSWVASNRHRLQGSLERARDLDNQCDENRADFDQHSDDLRQNKERIGRIFKAENEGKNDERVLVVDLDAKLLEEVVRKENYSLGTYVSTWAKKGLLVPPNREGKTLRWQHLVRVMGVRAWCYRLVLPADKDVDTADESVIASPDPAMV